MEFIDHTGHIFSLTSFSSYPTGYEYEIFKHVLWVEDTYMNKLSINEWYIQPVRVLLHKDIYNNCPETFKVTVDSGVFKLISGSLINETVKNNGMYIELDESSDTFKSELLLDDMMIIEDNDDILLTFYVAALATEPATWTTNILIEAANDNNETEWCPVTVGGVFYDEQEELIINGRNMGVHFPKDILHALYPCIAGTSIYSRETNEALYNEKVKEYLMNYMRLHGECGNLDQLRDSLKFFGWGSKLSVVQLVRTDNEIITQYIRDFLSNTNDILKRMEHFVPTPLISLIAYDNNITDDEEYQNYDNDFWGEMKPVMEDLMNKIVYNEYDNVDIKFARPYYDYVMTELMLKLSCLKYYYKKYFLPMHVDIINAGMQHQVFSNDIKLVDKPYLTITEKTFLNEYDRSKQYITFPNDKVLYAYSQIKYVDGDFNSFSDYAEKGEEWRTPQIYYIDDICIDIPIKFNNDLNYYNCHIIIENENGVNIFENHFSFSETDSHKYESLVLYPPLINDWKTMNYWENKKYCLHMNVNDIWYQYHFTIRVPEMHLKFGKLQYEYSDKFKQIESITDNAVNFQAFMYMPSLIDVNNIRFPQEVVQYGHDGIMNKFIDMYRESPSIMSNGDVSKKFYNRVHYYKLVDENGDNMSYDENITNEDLVRLYSQIYNQTEEKNRVIKFFKEDTPDNIIHYDVYLMHDSTDINDYNGILDDTSRQNWQASWYIVLISQETISDYDDTMLKHPSLENNIMYLANEQIRISYNGKTYTPQYMNSDNKWLINRMNYIPIENGVNHFNTDDIIVGTVDNFEFPFILSNGSKWCISPVTKYNSQLDTEVESTTNTFLMSLGGDNVKYDPGYYNITVRYSMDGTVQYQRKHNARLLIQ